MRFAIYSHWLTRRATAALLTLGLVLSSAAAWAVDKQDILNMHSLGMDPNVIVSVIRSDTVDMTEADVDELRAAGVAETVLGEICVRIGCASAAGPGPVGPGPVGPGPVGPNLQQEFERQQELERQRLEQQQREFEAQQQQMRDLIENENARRAEVQAAFAGLADADRDFRNRRFLQAAQAYNDFLVNIAPAPDSNEYYQALTGFVRSMHAAGYRHVVRRRALEAVLYGPASEHFVEMFDILRDVANDAAYYDPQFEGLTGFTIGGFPQEFQDEYNFFLGRYFWIYGENRRALEYLDRVSATSPDKAKAHYLSAVIYLDLGEQGPLFAEMQSAVESVERYNTDPEVAELAFMALARLAYQIGQVDAALYYYQKVEDDSQRHPTAIFETAWSYFVKQDWNRAIGTLHTLHSPYYDHYFFPDLYVIEAATYLQTCHLDAAEAALAAFYDQNSEMQAEVQAFLADPTNQPQTYWDAVVEYYEREGTGRAVALPEEAVRYVLADPEFRNQAQLLAQLDSERERLRDDRDALGEYGQQALAGLEADLQNKLIAAGLLVNSIIRDFDTELTDWNIKAQEVGIEVSTARLDLLDRTLEGSGRSGEAGTTVFVLAQDWQYWPFEGEYWLDEVDAFRGNLQSYRDDNDRCFEYVAPVEE